MESPTKQELVLWSSITEIIKQISTAKPETDSFCAKINKVHHKLAVIKVNENEFNMNTGLRMQGMYKEALDGISKEEEFGVF
jgi:uncharacterized protein YdaL